MISVGAIDDTFKFRVLSPVSPTLQERLKSVDVLANQEDWSFKKDSKRRKIEIETVSTVWDEFRNLNMKQSRTTMRYVPP